MRETIGVETHRRCGQGASSRRSAPAGLATKNEAGHVRLQLSQETVRWPLPLAAAKRIDVGISLALEALLAFQSVWPWRTKRDKRGHGLLAAWNRPWVSR